MLKKLLKKLPVIKQFLARYNTLLNKLDVQTQLQAELAKKVDSQIRFQIECKNKIDEQIQSGMEYLQITKKQIKKCDEINSLCSHILKNINKKILYNVDFERKMLLKFYELDFESEKFKHMFLNLIKDLDGESINNVVTIIHKWQRSKNTLGQNIDLYSLFEQNNLRMLVENFFSKKYQLYGGIYGWQNYLLPFNEFNANVFYFKHGIAKLKNLDNLKIKNILDVGGFVGESALVFSDLTEKNVYSFEPVKTNYELMLQTVSLNNKTNIICENYAVGASAGTISLNVADSCSSVNKLLARECERIDTVEMISVDDYVASKKLAVGMIKVDIEGYEQEFLKGAINVIKSQRPVLLISIYHTPDDFFNIKPLIESWKLGYSFKIFKAPDFLISLETMLIAEVEG